MNLSFIYKLRNAKAQVVLRTDKHLQQYHDSSIEYADLMPNLIKNEK